MGKEIKLANCFNSKLILKISHKGGSETQSVGVSLSPLFLLTVGGLCQGSKRKIGTKEMGGLIAKKVED